ncbi:MAG: LysR substrate-binding domain-containing protein [Steroidobacteraceae bacterium]
MPYHSDSEPDAGPGMTNGTTNATTTASILAAWRIGLHKLKTEWLTGIDCISRHGNLAAAAAQLGKTPAILRQQVSSTEQELGFRFFEDLAEGNDQPLKLTAAGATFMQHAQRLLQTAATATQNARQIAEGRSGMLRLGICEELATLRLAQVVRECHARLPDIQFEIMEQSSTALATALRQHQLDLALLLPDIDQQGITVEPLWQESWQVVLPPGHALAGKAHLDCHDLQDCNLVLSHPQLSPCGHDLIRQAFRDAQVTPQVAALVLGRATMLTLTNAGVGATFVPSSFNISATPGEQFPTMHSFAAPPMVIAAAYHQSNPAGVAMQFLRIMRSMSAEKA